MAKFFGKIGYAVDKETRPGIHEEIIIEKEYYGDLIRNHNRLDSSNVINDNVHISNDISILADPYAYSNFHNMRYVQFMGNNWHITSVDATNYPRLTLTLGGLYNGETES